MNGSNRHWLVAIVVVAAIAMSAVGWVLASGGGRTDAGPESTPPSLPASGAPSPAGYGQSGQDAQAGGSGQGGSQDGPGEGSDGGDSGGERAGPTIETFRVVQEPRCPGGTSANPIEGTPVTLEWTVTGAGEVTLSIDGEGIYNTYPADSSDTISFPCGGEAGDTQEHTYLLTAIGDGVRRTATLVVTATVHEVTDVG
jgi:hypothetical protein